MDVTKDIVQRLDAMGFRVRLCTGHGYVGEKTVIVETARKMCMGFYGGCDKSRNLYLTHVTVVAKDNGKGRWRLRRCSIKSHMICGIFVIKWLEDTDTDKEEEQEDVEMQMEVAGRQVRGDLVYANEETCGDVAADRAPWKRSWDNGGRCRDRYHDSRYNAVVTFSRMAECGRVDPTEQRVTYDGKRSGCWCGRGRQWAIIDEFSGHVRAETTLRYTGVHVWRHIIPGGKPWDMDATSMVDSQEGDARQDVMKKAVRGVHWGDASIVDVGTCRS